MRQKKFSIVFFFAFVTILSFYFYNDIIFLPPSHIHAWTQSDRYAIALNFIENGFDFFHPATYNLLTQNGITQVDFPINEFVVAIIMKISGSISPGIFRFYNLCYGIIGLFFLFQLTKEITRSEWKSFVAVIFLFSSPVYTYYQAGFLPSVPALANIIIGFYFLNKFYRSQNHKFFHLSILFFTLAALVRLPFLIFLAAIIVQHFFDEFKRRTFRKSLFFSCCLGVLSVIGYFLYNKYLGNKYGTMFLTSFLPVENWDSFKEIALAIWENWVTDYFTVFHYALLLIGIFFVFTSNEKSETSFSIALGLSLIGSCVFFVLMGQQFIHHDYYFIDSFFSGIIIGFVFLLGKISFKNRKKEILTICIVGGISLGAIYKSKKVLEKRYADVSWDMFGVTLRNFEGSKEFLDSLEIPENAKMLVIDAYSTNMPLIQMQRKGYTVISTERKFIENSMKNDFDFVVLQNQFAFQGTIVNYPEIMEQFELIGTNGKILVYKRVKQKITQTLSAFLGLDHAEKICSRSVDGFVKNFDDPHWQNCNTLDSIDFVSPNLSLLLKSSQEFGPTYTDTVKNLSLRGRESIWFSGKVKTMDGNGLTIVFSIDNAQHQNYHYASFNLKDFMMPSPEWKNIEYLFPVPEIRSGDDILKIYLWNSDKSTIKIDDLHLQFLRYK